MIADLGVPLPYRDAMQQLAGLPEEEAARLLQALQAVPPLASVAVMSAAVTDAFAGAEPIQIDCLVPPLLSLRSEFGGWDPDEIAAALSESTDLTLSVDGRERLRERSGQILMTTAVTTTAVGIDLLTQHERNYGSARIFTDVRPLFGLDVESAPIGAVVIEMLQLQTWGRDRQGQRTIHVAMDEADLLELQGVIERALKKTATVKASLRAQGTPTFELDERRT